MEMTWPMRLRILGVLAIGVVFMGMTAWPIMRPIDPMGAVTFFNGDITLFNIISCVIIAFVVGFIAYFPAYPYGHYIAPIAAPAALAYWAFKSGTVATLLHANHTLAARQDVYSTFRWETLLWLGIAAAGFGGVLAAKRIVKPSAAMPSEVPVPETGPKDKPQHPGTVQPALEDTGGTWQYVVGALAVTVIAHFLVNLLAQDVRNFDNQFGSVVSQPGVRQVAFAVFAAFLGAAFVVKLLLGVSYLLPAACTVLVMLVGVWMSSRPDILEYMVGKWPVYFFPRPGGAILPIQMVAFGTLGSVAGYWLAIQYDYWRRSEKKEG